MNYQPRGITIQGPASYASELSAAKALLETQPTWNGVTAEAVARMRLQNRFKTGLDIARYTAAIMRSDMAAYDADPAKYTQSLGCWHGFIAQQKMISIKKHFGARPIAATSISRAGWSPHFAPSSARCPTSRCTRRPRCRR